MPKELTTLFYPKSVAVIGASRSAEKVGFIILKNILDSKFSGSIYPVNPNSKKIIGLKCFPNVDSIPEVVDLAIIAIPAEAVIEVMNQIGEKGIKNVAVIAAGFKEIGDAGEKLEKELVGISEKYGINLLGPNCLGFVNNLCPINATFGQPVTWAGNLRFISQSGAIAASIFDWCRSTELGFSEFVTLGNKAVLNENDILHYFLDQTQGTLNSLNLEGLSNVYPIGLYLESISNGTEFLRIAREISKKNPMFVLKPGKTEAAAKAMQSHTGAIAGEDDVLEALLFQTGVIRCRTLEDFFDFSRAFAWEDVPVGPNVAIISNAGGPAVISADAVVSEGLKLVEFDDQTRTQLEAVLPRSASIINPVDVLGDALAKRFSQAAEIIIQKADVHSLVIILTPQLMTQIEKTAEVVGDLSKKYKKPIFASFIGGKLVAEGEQKLNEYRIPSFRYPERAIAAIGAMWKFKKQLQGEYEVDGRGEIAFQPELGVIKEIIQRAFNDKHRTLDNLAADKILSSAGITTPPTQAVSGLNEAEGFAMKHGWPVVLKLSSPGLLHKKEVGGVILDIMNKEQLQDAWHKLERKVEQLRDEIKDQASFQIQKGILNGIEVIVGVKRDPNFGPVLLFGAGGTYTELIADRNLHLLPIDLSQAQDLVKRSKVYSLLKGSENEPSCALDKLYDLIVRVGRLADLIPEATDIEINPVFVTLNDVMAVDGKIILRDIEHKPAVPPKLQVALALSHEVLATQFHFYEFEAEKPLIFKPGQYISVKVASDAVRAYSIAAHNGPNKFNLLVDTRPGGPGSKFFESLKVGDKITYMGPFGVFTLNLNDDVDHLLFLATGSGSSSVRCMIDVALNEYNLQKPMTLYFGLTYPKEVFWKEHFEELSKKYPNFNYEYVVFEPDEAWNGRTGFITKLVEENFPDARKCAAYLCGHKAMIADATDILLKNGCPKERIYTERFV